MRSSGGLIGVYVIMPSQGMIFLIIPASPNELGMMSESTCVYGPPIKWC